MTTKLKIIKTKSNVEGFTGVGNNLRMTAINIEKLWNENHSFERFAKKFTKIFEHETIHRLIYEELGKKRRTHFGEEYIVRKLTREKFPKKQQKSYVREGYLWRRKKHN